MAVMIEIRSGLWTVDVDLPEFPLRGAVVIGQTRALIWDSLSRPADLAPVASLLGVKDFVLVYSHADWDHIWGTVGLPYQGHDIVAHLTCLARFSQDVPGELAKRQAAEPGLWDDVVLVPPTIGFSQTHSIDLGGVTVELHALPGHTEDSIVALIPEWGVLLAGDTVETPLPVINEGSPVQQWIAALRGWEKDKRITLVIPAHGPMGGRTLISHTANYLDALLTGHTVDLPTSMPDFYHHTHQSNLEHISSMISFHQ